LGGKRRVFKLKQGEDKKKVSHQSLSFAYRSTNQGGTKSKFLSTVWMVRKDYVPTKQKLEKEKIKLKNREKKTREDQTT